MDLSSVEIFPFVLCKFNCNENRAKTPFCLLICSGASIDTPAIFFFWSNFAPEQTLEYLIKPNDSAFLDLRPGAEDLRPKFGVTPAQISLIKPAPESEIFIQ